MSGAHRLAAWLLSFSITVVFLAAFSTVAQAASEDSASAFNSANAPDYLSGWLKSLLPPPPAITPSPTALIPETVKIAFTGDLMVHEWQVDNAYDKSTGTYDFNYCFDDVRKYLSEADYTVGNLETVFAGKQAGYSYFPIFNAPDEFAAALKNAGFDFLSMANNHCNDKRKNGILRTIDIADTLELEHAGTYKSQEERGAVFIKEINSIKFAFLSYTYGTNGIPLAEPYLANVMDEKLIADDIRRAKALNPDFIIVLPHMGNEYETYPREIFKRWIMSMFEAGADIVVASHPHVLQPMELVSVADDSGKARSCFVAYSVGNFISSQRTYPRDQGIILNIEFEKPFGEKASVKRVSYIPTWVKFISSAGSYDIRVLSVYDTLTAHAKGEDVGLRPGDINRLKQVHKEISKLLLGRETPLEEIRNEYELIRKD